MLWICYESALLAALFGWTCHESVMNQLFHGQFKGFSWHFLLWPCLDLPWKWHESAVKTTGRKRHESAMNVPNPHETYVSDSSRIHGCQSHLDGNIIAVSWHFHIQAWPGYSTVTATVHLKTIRNMRFSCRFVFFLDFSFISCSMSGS